MSFSEPIDQPNESVDSLTWRGNNAIEQQVRAAPEDWFWVHNRWKTPKPNFLLTHYKRGVFVPPGCAEQLQPFRIAVRAPNWLGDSIISMPAVRALKAGRPDAQVTIIAPEKFAAVWRLIPETHDVIPISRKSVLQVARLLRDQQPFDVAVAFPGSFRAALEIFLGGVPRRVGFRGHCRAWLLNQIVPARQRNGPIDHQVNDYLHLVDVLGGSAKLQLPALATSGLTSNRIGLCPGAEYGPAKRWLPERFAEVAAAINQQRRVEWVLFGTKSDEEIGATIETMLSGNCTNLIGKTSVQQLIDELRRCRLLLTNDTGTMHLATLLGIPVVAIFGSTEPQLTGPLGKQARVIRHHVECSPCFLRECPIDFRCMHAVGSSEVAAAVLQVLD
jgi:lipopolysaccharide heptosyltransferase II